MRFHAKTSQWLQCLLATAYTCIGRILKSRLSRWIVWTEVLEAHGSDFFKFKNTFSIIPSVDHCWYWSNSNISILATGHYKSMQFEHIKRERKQAWQTMERASEGKHERMNESKVMAVAIQSCREIETSFLGVPYGDDWGKCQVSFS